MHLDVAHVQAYLAGRLGRTAEVVELQLLDKRASAARDAQRQLKVYGYGQPVLINYRVEGTERRAVLRTMAPNPFGHEHRADRAAGLLLSYDTFSDLPQHVRALDVRVLKPDGQLTSVGESGETAPERVFASVPGIGPMFAERIHEQLGIEPLLELEAAAYDGRLAHVPGFGPRRVRAMRKSLAGRFRNRPRTVELARPHPAASQPPVAELLDLDQECRQKARTKGLPRIAPRRFNSTRAAWLSVLHTQRGPVHYTALFSNTAHAHELGAVHDWVVIYRDDADGAGQWTVVIAQFGGLRGKRIVRGREAECERYYAVRPATTS